MEENMGLRLTATITTIATVASLATIIACGPQQPIPTVTVTTNSTDSAIEQPPTPEATTSPAADTNVNAKWVKVAQMTSSSSSKSGAIFEVTGEKQKVTIDYASGEYGAGATLYVFAKGDNSSDGYTGMFDTDKSGESSSLLYLDPGSYYLNLCVFGGEATGTLYDYR
jgi:hypothetical protein